MYSKKYKNKQLWSLVRIELQQIST